MSSTEHEAYCDSLEVQLQAMEGQVDSVIEKTAQGTEVEKDAVTQLQARFPEAVLRARRLLAALRQDGDAFEQNRSAAAQAWDELRALVENLKAISGG